MKKRLNQSTFIIFIIIITLLNINVLNISVNATFALTETELEAEVKNADIVIIYDQEASKTVNIDGIISIDEYPESYHSEYADMDIGMVHNGTHIFVALLAPTTGYVSVGFNKLGLGMVGADIKTGFIIKNETQVVDSYSRMYGYPVLDESQFNGGESDVKESAGTEISNITIIEFVFPMIPNNKTDLELIPKYNVTSDIKLEENKSYSLLLAWGKEDYMFIHYRKSINTMFIAPPGFSKRSKVNINFQLGEKISGNKDTIFTGIATLKDGLNNNIANKEINLYMKTLISDVSIVMGKTDSSGSVSFTFKVYQEYQGNIELFVRFDGDLKYIKGQSNKEIITYNFQPEEDGQLFLFIFPANVDYLVPSIIGFFLTFTVVVLICASLVNVVHTLRSINSYNPDTKKKTGGNKQ